MQLPGGQPCESIVLQRFLLVILPVLSTMDLKGGTVAMSGVSRHSQETFILPVELWRTFRRTDRQSFGGEKFENAMNE